MSWVKNNEWLKPKTDNRVYWNYLLRFLNEYRRFRKRLAVAAIIALLGSLTIFTILPIFGLIQKAVTGGDLRLLAIAVLIYLFVQLFQVYVNYAIRVYRTRISSELNQQLVLKYYSKLLNISIEDFIEFKGRSNLFQRVIDAMAVTSDFTNVVIQGLQAVIIVLVTMIVIGSISLLVFGVVVIGAVGLFMFVFNHAPKVRVKHQRVLALNYPLVSKMLEIIQAIFTIKALTASIQISSDIKELVHKKKVAECEEVVEESYGFQGAQALSQITLAIAICLSFILLIQQKLTYSEAFALYVLVSLALVPIVDLAKLYQTLSSLSGNVQNYFQVLDMQDESIQAAVTGIEQGKKLFPSVSLTPPESQERVAEIPSTRESMRLSAAAQASANASVETTANLATTMEAESPQMTLTRTPEPYRASRGRIVFDDVEFAYRGGDIVVQNLSFEILPGESISLIGRSGVGKTTVLRLMMGFLRPQYGAILVDGVDISRLEDKNEFRRQFAVVGQNDFFFGTSIRENLLFGLEVKPPEKEIEQALRLVNLWDGVARLEQGLDSLYRDDVFSGGQKQRFFIARALLRDPAIVLLDEPTSALDFENEEQVLRAIHTLIGGRTTITIAHRLSTVRGADRVLVLHDRRIVASGSHRDLYASSEYYKSLCDFNSFIV